MVMSLSKSFERFFAKTLCAGSVFVNGKQDVMDYMSDKESTPK